MLLGTKILSFNLDYCYTANYVNSVRRYTWESNTDILAEEYNNWPHTQYKLLCWKQYTVLLHCLSVSIFHAMMSHVIFKSESLFTKCRVTVGYQQRGHNLKVLQSGYNTYKFNVFTTFMSVRHIYISVVM